MHSFGRWPFKNRGCAQTTSGRLEFGRPERAAEVQRGLGGGARAAESARRGGAGLPGERAPSSPGRSACVRARQTCWLADGVSPEGLSRRGHLRPAEGTWLGEFRPAEQGQAGRRARGASAAAAVRTIQGAGSGSRKLGKSFARSWGAAVVEVSATGWPPTRDFRDRDAWLSTSGFSRGRTLSGSWRVV